MLAVLTGPPRLQRPVGRSQVILGKDAEGNGYSPLADAGVSMYAAESTWSGSIHPTPEDLADLIRNGSGWTDEDAAPDDAERVIVLGPVN